MRVRKRSLFLGEANGNESFETKTESGRILRKETEVEIPQNFYG